MTYGCRQELGTIIFDWVLAVGKHSILYAKPSLSMFLNIITSSRIIERTKAPAHILERLERAHHGFKIFHHEGKHTSAKTSLVPYEANAFITLWQLAFSQIQWQQRIRHPKVLAFNNLTAHRQTDYICAKVYFFFAVFQS